LEHKNECPYVGCKVEIVYSDTTKVKLDSALCQMSILYEKTKQAVNELKKEVKTKRLDP